MNAKERICEYFNSGATTEQGIGLELEHFVVKNGKPLNYSDGVRDILFEIAKDAKRTFFESGNILGADMGEYTITLEPGAQMEISVMPFEDTSKIGDVIKGFYKKAEPVLKRYGAELLNIPAVKEELLGDIELIPKERYKFMDRFFKESGTMGRYMMRGSASTQVSVDYKSEEDFVKKFRAAYILTPILAFVCSNDNKRFKRLEIWDDVDRKRTYIPDSLFSDDFGFEAYADELLKVPAIFVPDGEEFLYTGDETIESLSARYGTDKAMTEHYLSMLFPDVRLKRYIEIRIADAMPADRATEYAQLIKRIFYTDALEEILKRYKGVSVFDIKLAKEQLILNGENAVIYGEPVKTQAEYLMNFLR